MAIAALLVLVKTRGAECSTHLPAHRLPLSILAFSFSGGGINPLATVVRYEFKGSARLTNTQTGEYSKTALAFTRVERHPTGQEISRSQEYYSFGWVAPGVPGLIRM